LARYRRGSHFGQGRQNTGFAHWGHVDTLLACADCGIGDQRIGRLTLGNGYADCRDSGKADQQARAFLESTHDERSF